MTLVTKSPGDEIQSEDINSTTGHLKGTSGYGQDATNLYRYNSSGGFSLTVGNQDTTNGLVQLWQYGTVGSATEIARATKAGILGKLRDKGGWTFNLDAYSTSTLNAATGSSSTTASDAAWTAVFSAVSAAGGGTVTLGPGSYSAPTSSVTNWQDNCLITGAGMDATTIIRPNSSNSQPILFVSKTDSGVANLTVDGNRSGNNGTTTGVNTVEVSIDGTRCFAYGVKVVNFNYVGIGMSGTENSVVNCSIGLTSPPSSYTALAGGSRDYGAIYGIQTGAGVTERRLLVMGTKVYGTRSAGIFIGGNGLTITACHVYDCHRGDFPDGIGGGQIAIAPTNGANRSTNITISDCHVGPITRDNSIAGTGITTGIEINSCDYVNISDCTIDGSQSGGGAAFNCGIAMDQGATNISITGGTIYGCVKGLFVSNAGGLAVKKFGVSNVNFVSNGIAIYPNSAMDEFVLANCRFSGSTTLNWNGGTAPTTVNWSSYGHIVTSGTDDIPRRLYQSAATQYIGNFINASSTGYGIRIQAGSSASEFLINGVSASGTPVFRVFGNGQLQMAGPANGQLVDVQTLTELTTIAAAATTDTSIQIPAGALVFAVSVRVTTAIPTAATFDVGISGATTRYGSGLSVAANTTNAGTNDGVRYYAAATAIRITPNLSPGANTGRVRVTIHFLTVTPPTS